MKNYPAEVIANIEAKYHLNEPLYKQYLIYLKDLAHGDFGPSFKYKDYTVNQLVSAAFPVSFKLGISAFFVALILGVSAGTIAALKQNKWLDYVIMTFAMTGVVIPSFVVAPLLVLIFSISLKWLPSGGWEGGAFKFMLMPMIALCLSYIASIARITRGSMIEVLHSNFIRTAKAKAYRCVVSTQTRFTSGYAARHFLYGTRFRGDYYWLHGDRKYFWYSRDWSTVCEWRTES